MSKIRDKAPFVLVCLLCVIGSVLQDVCMATFPADLAFTWPSLVRRHSDVICSRPIMNWEIPFVRTCIIHASRRIQVKALVFWRYWGRAFSSNGARVNLTGTRGTEWALQQICELLTPTAGHRSNGEWKWKTLEALPRNEEKNLTRKNPSGSKKAMCESIDMSIYSLSCAGNSIMRIPVESFYCPLCCPFISKFFPRCQ